MPNQFENEPQSAPATSGKAIASLVLGLLSFLCLPAIPGIILGILGIADVNRSQGRLKGSGLAITGIVFSSLGLLVSPILILVALLLPAVQKVRMAANRTKSSNNIKQIGLAYHNYAITYNRLPETITSDSDQPLLSWRVSILPFIEQDSLYRQFDLKQAWDGPKNQSFQRSMPRVYMDPSDPSTAPGTVTPYRSFVGPGTVFSEPGYKTKYLIHTIPDGTSNTILAVEAADSVPWSKPEELTYTPGNTVAKLGNRANDYFLVAMMDGSVRVIKKNVSEETLRRAIDPADGQPLGSDW